MWEVIQKIDNVAITERSTIIDLMYKSNSKPLERMFTVTCKSCGNNDRYEIFDESQFRVVANEFHGNCDEISNIDEIIFGNAAKTVMWQPKRLFQTSALW